MKNIISIGLLLCFIGMSVVSRGQEGYTIKKINIEGNTVLSSDLLMEQMNTRSASLVEKVFFWKPQPTLSLPVLEDDLDRLKRFYQRNGFLDPQVDYDLKVKRDKENVAIWIDIEEGTAIEFWNIHFSEPNDSAAAALLSGIKEGLPLQSGERFVDRKVFDVEARIQYVFNNRGYPFVEVDRTLDVSRKDGTVDIHFVVEPGPQMVFGNVDIKGNTFVSNALIRKRLVFSAGDDYSGSKLDSSQQRLFETDLFRYAVIRPHKDSLRDHRIPVTIEVKEVAPWSLEAGVGYGTEDRFRVSVNLTRLHFLGGTRKFIFTGKRSYFLPISFETRFIQPGLLDDRLDLILNPFFIREREESYIADRLGGGLTFQQNFSQSASSFLMYSFERDFLKDFTLADSLVNLRNKEPGRNKSGITLGFRNSKTNSLFNPTEGWKLNGHFTYMGIGFRSGFHYYRSEIDLVGYHPVDDDWIVAGRLQAGFIKPLKGEATPIEDRFLIGGASSLRGWGRHQISPVNEQGKPTGGNSMLTASAELRFPIYDIFRGVAFWDAGNVWRNAFIYQLSDLRHNVGLGFRVTTPVGPLRLDLATPIFEKPHRLQFFVSIGHAF